MAAGKAVSSTDETISQALGVGDALPSSKASLPEQETLVRQNAKALHLIRQGLAYPYTPRRSANKAGVPVLGGEFKLRVLARLFKLEAQVRAAHGDWAGAADSDMDSIQMGEMCVRGGTMIAALLGVAVQAIGHMDLWERIDHLNGLQARQAVMRMQKIEKLHAPYAEVIDQEKREELTEMKLLFRQPNWRKQLAQIMENTVPVSQLQGLTPAKLTSEYIRYMDSVKAATHRPYNTAIRQNIPCSPAIAMFAIAVAPVIFNDTLSRTQHSLLLTALALQTYHAQRHIYPNDLTQLTPAILTAAPDDPFSDAPFKYRQMGARYLLYSVGPDGRDDGGKAISAPNAWRASMRNRVSRASLGDIVAGVNQ
ncbi:hypothetical protein CCAX7_28860 [Capsulimonas corticalis]|uniref:Uncharacterized protein n=1 Tax=Capsulimonas corticalis TaxID=2219043 RepID=A0A402CT76_9BACT|nr:hypothetical protein [Capsulimonas corticalis]BDI30835.1 hypothetical protein CCAX7_28860 [Capsulimonas corticalis]